MTSVEDRYLACEIDFEAAVACALGTSTIDRRLLGPILRALQDATHPASGLSAHDAALLDAVLAALPEDLHPLSLLRLLTTPQPDLRLENVEVPIIEWLAAGGAVTQALGVVDAYLWA